MHGGRWSEVRNRYGDGGRDAALQVGRHAGRMGPKELAGAAGGIGIAAAGQAVRRLGRLAATARTWKRRRKTIEITLSKSEM